MAMFHFRIKSDKKSDGSKVSAVQHVYHLNSRKNILLILLKKLSNVLLNPMLKFLLLLTSIILIMKRLLLNVAIVFSILTNYQNGLKMTQKNFFKLPISLKVNLIADTLKLNLPFLMD